MNIFVAFCLSVLRIYKLREFIFSTELAWRLPAVWYDRELRNDEFHQKLALSFYWVGFNNLGV